MIAQILWFLMLLVMVLGFVFHVPRESVSAEILYWNMDGRKY